MADQGRTTRKIRQGKVDIDYEESSLVVHYDMELITVNESGRGGGDVVERIPETKRIKVKNLTPEKDMVLLAASIVEKCKYIHPSRTEEIEQLLIKLRKHVLAAAAIAEKEKERENTGNNDRDRGGVRDSRDRDRDRERDGERMKERRSSATDRDRGGDRDRDRDSKSSGSSSRQQNSRSENLPTHTHSPAPIDEDELLPPASMDQLDDYLDMLYQVATTAKSREKDRDKDKDGLLLQIKGTNMIRKLCRVVMNLEQLIQNGTVMGALTRVLQEEFKKSTDLTFNILRIFLAFSNFMEMHGLMAGYRIGLLTMKAIEFEVKRAEHREQERKEKNASYDAEISAAKKADSHDKSNDGLKSFDKLRQEKDRENSKLNKIERKQDKMLFVAFYILLNLAEDVEVERKMLKRNLIDYLVSMLDRTFADLLVLVVTFLKKICVFDENKEALKEFNIVVKIARFIPCSSPTLVNISLRLLFNLSFDADYRSQMIKCGLVPKLTTLLRTPAYRARTLKLLYHISADEKCKAMITYTDGIPLLMGMVINFPNNLLAKELGALVINLSHNPNNAELMVANRGLNHLMDRLSSNKDPLLLKLIRNISFWTFDQQQQLDAPEVQYKLRGLWSPHLKVLMELATQSDNHDILVEVLGILANMTVLDLPSTSSWAKLIKDYNLLSLLSRILVPGMAQADLLLEVVMMVSSMASDDKACQQLSSSNIISLLYQLWKEKSDDVEIVLQLIHCFYKLFQCEASREEAMFGTRIVVDIIECLSHKNSAVRYAADLATELVLEYDRKDSGELGQLGAQIRKKRFESYNQVWLATVSDSGGRERGGSGDYDPGYMVGFDQEEKNDSDEDDSSHRLGDRNYTQGLGQRPRPSGMHVNDDSALGNSNDDESWEEKEMHQTRSSNFARK